MNLKEAFRFQNRIQQLMEEAQGILRWEKNVVKVENTALRHKVCSEAEDETTIETPETEFSENITDIACLLMYLLDERGRLTYAIRTAKAGMDVAFDGEVSLNTKRQELAAMFRRMSEMRSSEMLYPNGGTGYKFNAEGNQVRYHCDLKKVTTINFDRNKIRSFAVGLSKKADQVSAELDRQLVNTQVDYLPPFDVNDTFADVLSWFIEQNS